MTAKPHPPDRQAASSGKTGRSVGKWLLLVGAVFLLGIAVMVLFLGQEYYKQLLQDAVRKATGQELIITGKLDFNFTDRLNLVAEGVRLSSSARARRRWTFAADEVALYPSLLGLLQWRVVVSRVDLTAARLSVAQRDPQAAVATGDQPGRARSLPDWLALLSLNITDSVVDIQTKKGRLWTVALDEVTLAAQGTAENLLDRPVAGKLTGRIQGVPVTVAAEFGQLGAIWRRQPVDVRLDGLIGARQSVVRAVGRIDNVLRWRGLDLSVDAGLNELSDFSGWFNRPLPALRDISVELQLQQPGSISSLTIPALQATTEFAGVAVAAQGSVGNLITLSGMAFSLQAVGRIRHPQRPYLDAAELDLKLQMRGDKSALDFTVDTAQLQKPGLRLRAEGSTQWRKEGWQAPLQVTAHADDVSRVGALFQQPWPQLGAVDGRAQWWPGLAAQKWSALQLSVSNDKTTAGLSGDIDLRQGKVNGEMVLQGQSTDGAWLLDTLPSLATWLSPSQAKHIALRAAISLADSVATVRIDQMRLADDNLSLQADGSFRLPLAQQQRVDAVNLNVTGAIDAPGELPWLAATETPELAAITYRAVLQSTAPDGPVALDIQLQSRDENMHFTANGSVTQLTAEPEFTGQVKAEITAFKWLTPWLPAAFKASEWQFLLPVIAHADIAYHPRHGTAAQVDIGHPGGKLVLELAPSKPAAAGDGTVDWVYDGLLDPVALPAWLPLQLEPPILRLSGNGVVQLKNWRPLPGQFSLQLEQVGVHISVHGTPDSWSPLVAHDLGLRLTLDSLQRLKGLQSLALSEAVPVEADLRLDLMPVGLRSRGSIRIGASDVSGVVDWRVPTAAGLPPSLVVDLQSDNLDLRELLPKQSKQPKQPEQERWFSTDPLALQWLEALAGEVHLQIDSFKSRVFDLQAAAFEVRFQAGLLEADAVGSIGKGRLAAALNLDTTAAVPDLSLQINGSGLDGVKLHLFAKGSLLEQGDVGIDLSVVGSGRSFSAIAATADGHVKFTLDDARMKNESLDLIGSDLFLNVFSMINPFDKHSDHIAIECGVLRFQIADGVASDSRGIALKTDKVTVLGGGFVNLGDEQIQLILRPKARTGLGINPASVAKVTRLGGSLSKPKITAYPGGLLHSGAVLGIAALSGGLSLIAQGLFDRSIANSDVCALASLPQKPVDAVLPELNPKN